MADANSIAEQFVKYYYERFDQNRAELAALYRDSSMLSFEADQRMGAAAITEKLVGLPFQKVVHRHSTIDAQPAGANGQSLIVMVTGQLLIDDEQNPQMYTQMFLLESDGGGSFWVANDVFRLIYA